MTYRAAAATHSEVKAINSAHFVVSSTAETILYVNKAQYIGRYNTIEGAFEALRGLLLKCGCRDTINRFASLPITIVNAADMTPTIPDWTQAVRDLSLSTYGGSQVQLVGITSPIVVQISWTEPSIELWVKISTASIAANNLLPPIQDGYTKLVNNTKLVIPVNNYVRFKVSGDIVASGVATITNIGTNTVLDTFAVSVVEGI